MHMVRLGEKSAMLISVRQESDGSKRPEKVDGTQLTTRTVSCASCLNYVDSSLDGQPVL